MTTGIRMKNITFYDRCGQNEKKKKRENDIKIIKINFTSHHMMWQGLLDELILKCLSHVSLPTNMNEKYFFSCKKMRIFFIARWWPRESVMIIIGKCLLLNDD